MKAPKCKICGTEHYGLCMDHDAKGAIADQQPKRGRGRPKTVPDRKVYKAEKERQRRERMKDRPK